MAITFPTTPTNNIVGSGTQITITEPSGAGQDDIIQTSVYAYNSGSYPSLGTPSGWTKQHSIQYNSGSDYNEIGVYWIRRGASAPALTFTRSTGTNYMEAHSIRIGGCRTTGDPFTAAAVSTVTSAANIDPPSVATSAGEVVLCGGYIESGRGGSAWTAPSGYTIDGTGSTGEPMVTAYKSISSGSSEDPGAFSGAASTANQFGWSWSLTDAAGGGVSVNLSGSSSTSEAGTLTSSHSKSLSGQASTSQAGTLTPSVTLSLTGVSVETQAGNVSYSTVTDISLTLSGQSAAAQAGTITSSRTITLTGASSTAQTGTVTPTWQAQYSWDDITGEDGYRVKWGTSSGVYTSSADVAANVTSYLVTGLAWGTVYYARVYPLLGGVEQDPSVERVLTQNDVTVSLSGITVTASNGTITTASSKSLSGQEVLVGSGLIKSSFIKSLSGTSLETQAGNLIYASEGDLSLTLSGIEVSISSGNITSYIDLSLTGIEATSSAGTITASTQSNVEVTLSGQAVSAFAGTLVPSLEIPGGGQSGGSGGIIPGIRIKGRIFQWRVY